jgi:hypothetical protein
LLHFLLLGLGLFVLHHFVAAPGDGSGERVVISRGKIQRLAAGFALMHQRAPAKDELDGLIAEAVREEILYREAKALGLDQDDTIVRRRLRQKLEFVSEDLAPASEPTEAQLQAYLASHLEQFRIETRYSFAQVYLDPQRHGRQLGADTAQLLSGLRRSGDAADLSQLGDSLLLQRQYEDIPARELERLFGAPFEAALRSVPTGSGKDPCPRATACTWCCSSAVTRVARRRWPKCATPCAASGSSPSGEKRTNASMPGCGSATK